MVTRFATPEQPPDTNPHVQHAEHAGHDVRFYEGDAFPASAAAEFLARSLRRDGTALVFANPEHTRAIARALDALGLDFEGMKACGRLVALDASAAVAHIERGADATEVLERMIRAPVRALSAKGRLRIVGEAVDLLARGGHVDTAIRLEASWSALRQQAEFELMCLYSFVSFQLRKDAAAFDAICAAHGAVQVDGFAGNELGHLRDLELARNAHSSAERLLARAAEELSSSLDLAETIARVAELAVPSLADWCLVDLVTEDGAALERVAVGHHSPDGDAVRDAMKRRHALSSHLPGIPAAIARREVQIGQDKDDSFLRAIARDEQHLETLRKLKIRSYVAAPLVTRGRAIGALTFITSERNFEPHETWLVEQLAASAAAAIGNARLFEAEQNARMRIGKMQDVTAALSRARTADEVAEVACRIGSTAMAARSGALWLVHDGALRLAGSWGSPMSMLAPFREIALDREGLPATVVVRTGQPIWVESEDDYRDLAPAAFEHAKSAGRIASYGAVPLRVDEQTVGVITFTHPCPHRYAPDERAFYATLAQHCSQALDRARLLDAERRSNARLRLLASAGETLASSLELDDTLRAIARLTVPAFADWCFLDLVEPSGEVRRLISVHANAERVRDAERISGERPVHLGDGSRLAALIEGGEPAFAADVDPERLRAAARDAGEQSFMLDAGIRSAVVIPLSTAEGERMGALSFMTAESKRRYDADDLDFARELGRRVGLAVVNARLYRAAQDARRTAEEANRVKDDFLATVSHELRTPLNAIGGWASLLAQSSSDPAAVQKGLEVIRRNVQSQTKLVEDILDASRIVSGTLRIDPRPVDLLALVRDALDVVRPSAQAKRIAIDAPRGGVTLVAGDAQRLQQVVWNLVSNAVKFTPEGGHVTVRVEGRGASVVLAVDDDGPGIDPAFLPYVFDRFRQADSGASRRFGGLGLGLAIVRHIVELHGGSVEAVSAGVGRGASFRVILPTTSAGERVSDTRVSTRPPAAPSVAGMRILIVDDDDDARGLLEVVLEGDGARVQGAASAREAFARVETFAPDVIVSDIGMPDEDGYSFIRRVRATPSPASTTPAIALTAYARADDRLRALTAGFNAHVLKPVDADELVTMIANLRLVGKA